MAHADAGGREAGTPHGQVSAMEVTRTRDGRPAIWEAGGGASNTGDAVIVAGPAGQALPAAYIRRAGPLACAEHALVPVSAGCYVVEAQQWRGDVDITIHRIDPAPDGGLQVGPVVAFFLAGVWTFEDGVPPVPVEPGSAIPAALAGTPLAHLAAAVEAAMAKSTCYHCREPHYVAAPRHVPMRGEA